MPPALTPSSRMEQQAWSDRRGRSSERGRRGPHGAALRRDVILLDSRLFEAGDIEAIRRIARPPDLAQVPESARAGRRRPRVLVLAEVSQERHAHAAPRAEAGGFLPHDNAERLVLTESTVNTHITRILATTGTSNRVQAAAFACKSGLVRPAA